MDWQQILSLVVVAVTAILLIWNQVRRSRKAKKGICPGECACPTTERFSQNKPEWVKELINSKS